MKYLIPKEKGDFEHIDILSGTTMEEFREGKELLKYKFRQMFLTELDAIKYLIIPNGYSAGGELSQQEKNAIRSQFNEHTICFVGEEEANHSKDDAWAPNKKIEVETWPNTLDIAAASQAIGICFFKGTFADEYILSIIFTSTTVDLVVNSEGNDIAIHRHV